MIVAFRTSPTQQKIHLTEARIFVKFALHAALVSEARNEPCDLSPSRGSTGTSCRLPGNTARTHVQDGEDLKPFYVRRIALLQKWIPGDTVYFEHHAGDAPSYMTVRYNLHKWRTMATELNVPFFAYTLYREPVNFALSRISITTTYFNYYHAEKKH